MKDQTVLVLGLGASGLAIAQWCARAGAQVRVADSREAPPQAAALAETVPGARVHVGFDASLLDGVSRVFKSPGLSPRDAALQPLLARAAELGLPVQGELDLFAQALADLKAERGYAPKVIAITGTNGKTTTTMMCGQLVARTGVRVAVAGNVGPTMLATLAAALELEPAPVPATDDAVDAEGTAAVAEAAEASQTAAGDSHGVAKAGAEIDAAGHDEAVAEAPAEAVTEDAAEAATDAATDLAAEVAQDATEATPIAAVPADDDAPAIVLIAPPPPPPVFEHLPEVWVLELSSFQLDGVQAFAPSAAVVLNVTQDHLDWHGTLDAYAAAKARVYGPAESLDTIAIVNRDDPPLEALLPVPAPAAKPAAKPGSKGRSPRTPAAPQRRVIRFGLGAPQAPGDYGVVVENGMAWMVRALEADATLKRRRSDAETEAVELHLQRLMPADALRIRGRHNVSNALAALALATAVGRPLAPMLHGLREYRGEPHRVEYIASVGGIEAFDDSKGTNVGATVAALEGLGADRAPSRLVVILGGDGKGQDFSPLATPVARHARAVALIGRDAGLIAEAIGSAAAAAAVTIERFDTLQAATAWSFAQARGGDAVLLSPACASFDMFNGYAHRAQVFADAVRALAADRGEAA